MNPAALVLVFREGLEAALIIAILLTYLGRTNRGSQRGFVWGGAGAAALLSLGFVFILQAIGASFDYPAKGIYEGVTSLLAVVMVTYMTFWVARHGRDMKGELEAELRTSALSLSVFGIAFLTVIREGVETALFLSAAAFESTGLSTLFGGLAGLLLAAAIAMAIYLLGVRIHLGMFFKIAGVLLIFFGASILRYGVHEFEEVGLLPSLIEHMWNTGRVLPDGTGLGAVLQALVGYTADPSLLQLIFYFGYFVAVITYLYASRRAPMKVSASTIARS